MNEHSTSRQKNRLETNQSTKRSSEITQDEFNLYLVKRIKKFQKKAYSQFFGQVRDWVIAYKYISIEQYEFIYSTPFIEILIAYLSDLSLIQSPEVLQNILQIVANLTTSEAPDVSAFLDETLLQNFASFLSNENPKVIQFTLIILSQLFDRQPTLAEYFNTIKLNEQLISTFLASENDGISGVSCYFLCQFVYVDNSTSETIFPILFEFISKGNLKVLTTLFQSFLYFSQKSPDFCQSLISCDFCSLCAQVLSNPNDSNEFIRIATFIIKILNVLATIDANPIQASNIISIIAQLNYFDSSQNPQLLQSIMTLLTTLVQKEESSIDKQLIENTIFQACSELATTASYNASINYLSFICASLQRKDASICELCMPSDIISRVFDIFETLDSTTAALAVQAIIDLLTTKPELKPILKEKDFDAMLENANEQEEGELDDLVQLLLSMTEEE